MARKYELGDVHAPVEDTEVPFSLKLLVLFMMGVLVLAAILLLLLANQFGMLDMIIAGP
jgi:hypothetical protein